MMAKDQFKAKTKIKSLAPRFGVFPLIDHGEEFLCVDANFNFVAVKRWKIEQYSQFALSETFDKTISEQAQEAAKAYLPSDPKQVEKLVYHLKHNGADGFEEELQKMMEA
jgi:hypothetical protein